MSLHIVAGSDQQVYSCTCSFVPRFLNLFHSMQAWGQGYCIFTKIMSYFVRDNRTRCFVLAICIEMMLVLLLTAVSKCKDSKLSHILCERIYS